MQRDRSHVKMLRDTQETIPGRRKQRLKRSIHKPRRQAAAKLRKRETPPESPWREPGPAETLIPTSSLQNCERIHFSCFSKASRRGALQHQGQKTLTRHPPWAGPGGGPCLQLYSLDVPQLHPLSRPPRLRSRALPPAASLSLVRPSLHTCWGALHHCWGPGLQYDPAGHSGAHSHT